MELNEIYSTYSLFLSKIEDLWRSLWTRKKTSKNKRIRRDYEQNRLLEWQKRKWKSNIWI